jgi:hypothetical protein
MTIKAFIYDIAIKVAVMAETEEEANEKMEQGQASQISMERNLVNSVDIG